MKGNIPKESKGRGKYKGKIPLFIFSCEEVGHIATRHPNKEDKDEKKRNKYKGKKEFKTKRTKRTKVRNLVLWLKILITVKMKWYTLL